MKPIEELRAAHAATTQDEWVTSTNDFIFSVAAVPAMIGQTLLPADAAFIALAHNEFPAMLDEIEALRHQLR